MPKLRIDHSFVEDKNFKFFKMLGKMGFNLSDMEVEHPGKAFCRFILFESKDCPDGRYLEFVNIGKGGVEYKKPGLSFGVDSNLKAHFNKISKKLDCKYVHKNYNWIENDVDYLPGWNFIELKRWPIRNIFTWFTENEPEPGKKKKRFTNKAHPNSVYDVYGIELTLSEGGKKYLENLLGLKLKEKTRLPSGHYIYAKKGRVNRFENVILKCKSLKRANKYIKSELVGFDNKNALKIVNPTNNGKMYNLVVIED